VPFVHPVLMERGRKRLQKLRERRMKAAALVEQGERQASVAHILGVSRQRVSEWWLAWRNGDTEAMAFAGRIADLVEVEQYHPDLLVSWGKVQVTLSTDSVGGLSENDFVLAAKVEALPREGSARGRA
jgi:pterin-4a-carbinolamine dehydratase